MSILIKGMEMPKACVYRENGHLITCPLYDIDGYCGALRSEASHKEDDVLSNCPLVPVPPHGRLIDADALDGIMVEQSGKEYNHHHAPRTWERALSCFRDYIKDAPTIIPAEEATQKDGGQDKAPAGPYDLLYEEGGPDA